MVQIAGGVVWNPKLGIAIVNQNHNSWSFPKGHVEAGENNFVAAMREIEEETGIPSDRLEFISTFDSYEREMIKRDPEDKPEMRSITFFFFTTDFEDLKPQDPENPEARWVPIRKVTALLTHPRDRQFFGSIKRQITSLQKK